MTSPDGKPSAMEATNVFYRNPALHDAVQADSGTAETCQALIDQHQPDAATLVDFGCGTGRDLEILAKRFECVGVDLWERMVFATFPAHARPGATLVLCSPVSPITQAGPTTATVETPDTRATVTVRYEWDLRTQINTMHRLWTFESGEEAQDVIRRRVLFPRELEHYAAGTGFEVVDMVDESAPGSLTGPTAYTVARYRP
ncbi:class I SAM-dependent methyltransferase [Streptomyces sp. NPDC054855]